MRGRRCWGILYPQSTIGEWISAPERFALLYKARYMCVLCYPRREGFISPSHDYCAIMKSVMTDEEGELASRSSSFPCDSIYQPAFKPIVTYHLAPMFTSNLP